MEEEENLKPGKPCPYCGNMDFKKCRKCEKLICPNCSPFFKTPGSSGYLCEACFIKHRKKTVRVI